MQHEIETFEREILLENVPSLEKKVKAFARICEKLGMPEPELTLLGSKRVRHTETGLAQYVQSVRLVAPTPVLEGGYRIIASVRPLETEEGIKPVVARHQNPEVDLPAKIDPTACDYCKKKRNRKLTFIVWSPTKNNWRQVGGECVKDFLGHDPADLLAFQEALDDLEEDFEPGGGLLSGDAPQDGIDTLIFLELVAYFTDRFGYVSGSSIQKYDDAGMTTAEEAWEAYYKLAKKGSGSRGTVWPTQASHKKIARDALAWAKNLPEDSEFNRNLRAIATSTRITHPFAGMAAYIVGGYVRQHAAMMSGQGLKPIPERGYIGTVGERRVFKGTLLGIRSFSGQYGMSHYHEISVDGNLMLWKGTKSIARAARVANPDEFREWIRAYEWNSALGGYTPIPKEQLTEPLVPVNRLGIEAIVDEKGDETYVKFLTAGETFFFAATISAHEVKKASTDGRFPATPQTVVKNVVVFGDPRKGLKAPEDAPLGSMTPSLLKEMSTELRSEFETYANSIPSFIEDQQDWLKAYEDLRNKALTDQVRQALANRDYTLADYLNIRWADRKVSNEDIALLRELDDAGLTEEGNALREELFFG